MSSIESSGGGPLPGAVALGVIMEEGRRSLLASVQTVEHEWKNRAQRSRRTGNYLRSIHSHVIAAGRFSFVGIVGSSWHGAIWLEKGTGIYGPANRPITPKRGQALRWPAGGRQTFNPATGAYAGFRSGQGFTMAGRQRSGAAGARAQFVFRRSVKGMRPRRYAADAARISLPRVERHMAEGGRRAAARLTQAARRRR